MLNAIFLGLGIESWKPWLSVLILPPLPLLALLALGAALQPRRRRLGSALLLIAALMVWLMCTHAAAKLLSRAVLQPSPVLHAADIDALRDAPRSAIVVLGGGRQTLAPEYGQASLNARSLQRLRYGIWLSRQTGLPLAFSGGVGHGADRGPSEAELAAQTAAQEFGHPLRWQETSSRDTRENARQTLAVLNAAQLEQIVLVTHGYHMRRALRNFEAAAQGSGLRIQPAPMGGPASPALSPSDWLPTASGFEHTRVTLHEWFGLLAGA